MSDYFAAISLLSHRHKVGCPTFCVRLLLICPTLLSDFFECVRLYCPTSLALSDVIVRLYSWVFDFRVRFCRLILSRFTDLYLPKPPPLSNTHITRCGHSGTCVHPRFYSFTPHIPPGRDQGQHGRTFADSCRRHFWVAGWADY